jgi:hypothetical protein
MAVLHSTFSFSRVVVALDRAGASREALEIAARMASRWDSELAGLVILGKLSAVEIERAFRVQAREAQTALGDVCARLKLRSSFEVRRGADPGALLATAGALELLVLGWGDGEAAGESRRETLRRLAARAGGPLLLVRRAARARQPVTVLFEGSADVLAAGRELAALERRALRVLTGPSGSEAAERLDESLKAEQPPPETPVEIRHLEQLSLQRIGALLQGTPAAVLVSHRALLQPSENALESLLGHDLAGSILLLDGDHPEDGGGSAKEATSGA